MLIDPPGGWRYGFPKKYSKEDGDIGEFLVKHGYPREEVDFALRHLRCISSDESWTEEDLEILEELS